MRFESSVTTLSWIPSEAVTGVNKAAFGVGFTHYDAPLPDTIADLDGLMADDAFRFGNVCAGWIEVEDGRIVDAGHAGRELMGATTIGLGSKQATFAAVSFPVIRTVEVGETSARFVQTTGGHTAVPAPRVVKHPPFMAFQAPPVWTTLALTIHADGRSEYELTGASSFPRHWVYDHEGHLAAKAGLADFKEWWATSFRQHTPWGDEDSPVMMTAVETALERQLSTVIMRGGEKPRFRKLAAGEELVRQGDVSDEMFLLLNGVLRVEVDGEVVAELGPGAVLGERAGLETGARTSTVRAVTAAKVAVAQPSQIAAEALISLSDGHRREDAGAAVTPA